jgi:asparagine synthase (glutamine-hydrolysing)
MCGIFGLFAPGSLPDLQGRASAALAALAHRGPDDTGTVVVPVGEGALLVGQTRLSIIDLSAGGHQPMHSTDGRFTLVYNGEIYNYRELRAELQALGRVFRSDSDTEVLLNCWEVWGRACLPRLKGMFAFAIFDRHTHQLTCVRDAFGIKPLFYSLSKGCLALASEISAVSTLLSAPSRLNAQRAHDYLVHGTYDDDRDTFFEGIHHLPPAHILVVELGAAGSLSSPSPTRWWWPDIREDRSLSFAAAAERMRDLFLGNIRLHLRSDVPLGAALSGGLDSSAVVCAIRHVEPDLPIHTFTFVARGSAVNEEGWADRVNAHVGAVVHKVVVDPTDITADLDDMIRAQGEPFGGTSIYAQYRVFKLARDCGVKVTLDGQGADELLAGYAGYPGPRLHSLADRGQWAAMARFLLSWSNWPGRSIPRAVGSLAAEIGSAGLRSWMMAHKGSHAPNWIDSEALRERGVDLRPPSARRSAESLPGRRLPGALRQAMADGGLSHLLRHGDRNSMRWSIESRVPFLTTDLAEFSLSLPENFLVSDEGQTKHLFRHAMQGIVPEEILQRRDKIGFATPERLWIRDLGGAASQWLDDVAALPFLHRQNAAQHVEHGLREGGKFDYSVWRILNLARWAALHGVRVE